MKAVWDPVAFHPETLPHPQGGYLLVLSPPLGTESKLEVPLGVLLCPGVSGMELLLDKEPPWRGPDAGGHLSLKDEW